MLPAIFSRDIDLFDDMFPSRLFSDQRDLDVMKTDVKETANGYELKIDLPGVRKENLKAELSDGYLTISATTESEDNEDDKKSKYIRRERSFGSFSRTFYVGENLKEEDVKARFDNGILVLDIPKLKDDECNENKRYIAIEG